MIFLHAFFLKIESCSPIISTIFKTPPSKIWHCEYENNVSDRYSTSWASDSGACVQTSPLSTSHITCFSPGSWQSFNGREVEVDKLCSLSCRKHKTWDLLMDINTHCFCISSGFSLLWRVCTLCCKGQNPSISTRKWIDWKLTSEWVTHLVKCLLKK